MKANNRLLLVAFALGTLTFRSVARADELADIQQKLTDWRASIASIEIKYTITAVQQIIDGVDTLEGKSYITKGEWTWTDQGKWRYYFVSRKDGIVQWRHLWGSDGQTGFSAIYEQGESEFDRPDRVNFAPHWIKLGITIDPLVGLWYGNFGVWLPEMMRQHKVEYKGIEAQNGAPLACVEFPVAENAVQRLWLDRRRSFLPARVRIENDSKPSGQLLVTISDFFHERDELVFPKVGVFRQQSEKSLIEQNWVVDEVRWNKPIDPNRFIPPIAESTIINRDGKMQVAGGPAAREKLIQRFLAKADGNRGESQFPPGMAPPKPTTWWYSILVLFAAVVLLAIALTLRLRRAK